MSQPQTHLIQVVVTVEPHGGLPYAITSYFDKFGTPADPLSVNLGDQVGWLVQAAVGGNLKLMPYSLDFSGNPSFFGVSSLNVPAGGASSFLTVLAQKNHLKYSVNIDGLRTIDPDIQSGGDTGSPGPLTKTGSTAYSVFWDTANPATPMTYSVGTGAPQPLPLNVSIGDTVTFNATVGPGASKFMVAFARNHWASPFDPLTGTFCAATGLSTIDPQPVDDPVDNGSSFALTASIVINGNAVNSGPVAQNAIVVVAKATVRRSDRDK